MTDNSEHPLALPVGTELVGDYVITKVLGAGGFGITYEANERSLDRMVAIKEYFPVDIVEREGWALVKARSKTLDMKYARGLRRFIEEAKAITQFNHPNIVRVLRYFKTNNTAFMVLHYEEGVDMGVWRENLGAPPSESQLTAIINPLLDALELIHKNDFLHRDVAPDNIIIRKDGSPILIDFGSARSELTFNSKTVSALVKSGYSPFEQYAKNSKEQGPWTDIYSFGATLYQIVTGEAPPDSLSRLAVDEMIPAKKRAKKFFSRDFLAAIDSALAIKIEDRPQSIEEWRGLLFPANDQPVEQPKKQRNSLLAARKTGQKGRYRLPKPGKIFKNSGQASVADLMEKAGLKQAEIGGVAAKLGASLRGGLSKLVPQSKTRAQNNKARAPLSPPNQQSPSLQERVAVNEAQSPRSLRDLLDELDDEYKDGGHEQAIEKAANQPLPRRIKKPRKPIAPVLIAKIRTIAKTLKKIGQTLKRLIIKLFRSLSLLVRFAAGLLLLGGVCLDDQLLPPLISPSLPTRSTSLKASKAQPQPAAQQTRRRPLNARPVKRLPANPSPRRNRSLSLSLSLNQFWHLPLNSSRP